MEEKQPQATRSTLTYEEWIDIAGEYYLDFGNPDKMPPEEFMDEEMYTAILCGAPLDIRYVPIEKRTFDLCFYAVYQDDEALQFVPEDMRDAVKAKKAATSIEKFRNEFFWARMPRFPDA
jgi:hypothetical protein